MLMVVVIALDLGSSAARRASSSLASRTNSVRIGSEPMIGRPPPASSLASVPCILKH